MANGKWRRSEVGSRIADHGLRSGGKAETDQKLEMRCDREMGRIREQKTEPGFREQPRHEGAKAENNSGEHRPDVAGLRTEDGDLRFRGF